MWLRVREMVPDMPELHGKQCMRMVWHGVQPASRNRAAEQRETAQVPPRADEPQRLDDCKSWCDSLPTEEAPVKRISEAVAALRMPNSRKRRTQLESICKDWNVAQRRDQKKRALSEIESDLAKQIVQETQRLRTCHAQHGRCSSVAATRPRA